MGKKSLIYGVGLNDADYPVDRRVYGAHVRCPFYVKWASMIQRCYSDIYKKKSPAYEGCYVCDEWLIFSNFKAWMEEQDWQGKELDKDLVKLGNKTYSPETCAFVDLATNVFTTDNKAKGVIGQLGPAGARKILYLRLNAITLFTKKKEHLGHFKDAQSAHLAWKKRKHELACQLAELQTDERVANALRVRYL